MEDDPPKKRPKQKWKTNQSTKINLIGCDTIENSPSLLLLVLCDKMKFVSGIPIKEWNIDFKPLIFAINLSKP